MGDLSTLFPRVPPTPPLRGRPWATPDANAIRVPTFAARFAFTRKGVRAGWAASTSHLPTIAEELCLRLGKRPQEVWAAHDAGTGGLCLFAWTDHGGLRIAAWLTGAVQAADLNGCLEALAGQWDVRHPEGAA